MLLLGEMIGAEEAHRFGLVNRVVPAGEALEEAARGWPSRSPRSRPCTLQIGKRAFYEQLEMPLGAAYDHASRVMTENMLARDAAEGIGAFLERREPHGGRASSARGRGAAP